MRNQRLFQKVLFTDAFASPPRLPDKKLERGRNGSEGYIETYSEDDSQNVLNSQLCELRIDYLIEDG